MYGEFIKFNICNIKYYKMHIHLGTMLVSHNKIAHCENPRMVWYKFKVLNYSVLKSMKPYSSY